MAVVRWLRPPPYKRLSLANKRAFSIIAEIPIAELEMKRRIRVCEREDCTLVAWYSSFYAPRTGGAYDSHHRTAGIAGRAQRRGGCVAACGARALARPDAASDSSLREIVEFRERGLHGLRCAERGRSFFTRRPGDRTRRIEACARDTQVGLTPMSGGCKESGAECTPLTRVHRQG